VETLNLDQSSTESRGAAEGIDGLIVGEVVDARTGVLLRNI
jgi:hypothetical protein